MQSKQINSKETIRLNLEITKRENDHYDRTHKDKKVYVELKT
jgi:hypothetical protein